MDKHPRSRLGSFFTFIGLFLLILFIGAVVGKGEHKVLFLVLSGIALFFGYLLNKRPPAEQPPSARFSALRKSQERAKKHRETIEEKKQAEKR